MVAVGRSSLPPPYRDRAPHRDQRTLSAEAAGTAIYLYPER